jgi:ankyrin repeat protein
MKHLFLATIVFCMLLSCNTSASNNDLYQIINTEDKTSFGELLTIGFDVDDPDVDGNSPLIIASALGKVNFVEYLINMGADVNKKNYIGVTALHMAANGGHNDVIDMLLDNGAHINMPDMDGITPLMRAVENGRRFTVELLVHRGALIQFINAQGKTALDIAKAKRLKNIIIFLEDSIKNPKKKDEGPTYSWDNI